MRNANAAGGFSETTRFSRGRRKWILALVMLSVMAIAAAALRGPDGVGDPRAMVVLIVLAGAFLMMSRVLHGELRVTVEGQQLIVDLRPFGERRVYSAAMIRGVEEGSYDPMSDNPGWARPRTLPPAHALELRDGRGVWIQLDSGWRLFLPSAHPGDLVAAIEAMTGGRIGVAGLVSPRGGERRGD